MLKLKLRFSKCTFIMGRDHGHPCMLSTTVLSDIIIVVQKDVDLLPKLHVHVYVY